MQPFIPIYQPDLSGNEKFYVNECLDSTWISSKGRFVSEFETKFADLTQSKHALTVSNGTVALHLALLALGIGPGDEVIVPSFTYIASVNAIRYVGATPVFIEIEKESWQLDVEHFSKIISEKTRAIIAVHIYGHPCDMLALQKIAHRHSIKIIEDCAEAFGSMIQGQHVGTFSDIATYSFFGNKTVTTGEGGMVTTQCAKLSEKVRHLKTQGLADGAEYWHDIIGYNYRMTNICAALGLAQLERASELLTKKRQIVEQYKQKLAKLPLTFQKTQANVTHSWWMFSILVDNESQCKGLRQHLKNEGVETRPLFSPVNKMPMYNKNKQEFSISNDISSRGMNLPSWPGLTEEMIDRIASTIRDFFR